MISFNRRIIITLRLNQDELNILKLKALKKSMNVSDFIRELIKEG